jgi:hypothetical protein
MKRKGKRKRDIANPVRHRIDDVPFLLSFSSLLEGGNRRKSRRIATKVFFRQRLPANGFWRERELADKC